MPITHVNRRGKTYYLHRGKTKTGKDKYYLSLKSNGTLPETIPDGYELFENPNAQVFLRKIQPQLITDTEKAMVEKGMKKYSVVKDYQNEVVNEFLTFVPMLRFILIDEGNREFIAERCCFIGSIDDWIEIGGPDSLEKLVKKFVKHLGQDSFYELPLT